MAVYSHIVTKELQGPAGLDELITRTRAAGYDGPFTLGQDRMTIHIGEEVTITPPQSTEGFPMLDNKAQTFP